MFTKEGNQVCAEDPSSPIRLLRMHLAFFGCWRQMFMLYNLDAGIKAFSFQNVCLSLLVSLWFACMLRLNRAHMPDVPMVRLAVQHAVPGLICAGACLACVYPPIPTIYLIMMIEGTSKMLLTLFELALLVSPALKSALRLDVDTDPVDVTAFLRAARVPGMPLSTLLSELLPPSPEQERAGARRAHLPAPSTGAYWPAPYGAAMMQVQQQVQQSPPPPIVQQSMPPPIGRYPMGAGGNWPGNGPGNGVGHGLYNGHMVVGRAMGVELAGALGQGGLGGENGVVNATGKATFVQVSLFRV